jgi:isopenicillin N synthase-like dioxygenase
MEPPPSTPAPASLSTLPVIDLSHPDTAATAARLRAACMEEGFFYLIGHGVDASLMAAALAQCRAFFALPLEAKMALRPPPHDHDGTPAVAVVDASRGYSPFQSEMLNPQEQRAPCTQEGFRLKLTTGEGGPQADTAARAAHPWPDSGSLPAFRPTLIAYHEAMQALAYRVTQMLLEAVGLDRVGGSGCVDGGKKGGFGGWVGGRDLGWTGLGQ